MLLSILWFLEQSMMKAIIRVFLIGCVFLQSGISGPSDHSCFAARREILMKKIGESVAVLQGAPETRAYRAFRQDNNFYYLTGVEVPNALLLIDGIRHRSVLFLPPRDGKQEQWEGARLYPGSEARKITGFDEVLDRSQFEAELEKRRDVLKFLFTPLVPEETAASSRDRALRFEQDRLDDAWDGRISRQTAFGQSIESKLKPVIVKDLSPILDEMRRVKDAQEIERLREAGRIGALGIREAIRSAKPGMFEYQVAATAEFIFLWHGASGNAFFPIVGSGPNSCVVHYSGNGRKMESGDIAVIDFGPDYRYYSSDITRTFPLSGRFTEEQAKVYQIVLDAQKAAIEKIKPGGTFDTLNETVREVLDRKDFAKFLIHGVSHYIGMSTHDVGKSERFEPGVVIAIEPGVYMPGKNLGVRIEDTVLVTRDGCEILTKDVPKEISEIEKLMTEKGAAETIRP
jgi:Xaa-Pro aminopeptidase